MAEQPSSIVPAAAGAPPPPGPDEEDEKIVPLETELDKKIAEIFFVFDVENMQMCELRDVSTILRGLGMCPTEQEVNEIIEEVEHPRLPGNVHLRHFLPVVVDCFIEHKFEPERPEELLEAFRVLDPLGKGFISKQDLIIFMTQYGEPLSQDEIDEMLELAIDPLSNTCPYHYYINQIIYEPSGPDNVYAISDVIEAEKAAIRAAEEARRKFFFGGGN
ncbi:unnamed protein product [Phyllotreta striolata]|uniref:EF-hand domain-containing protein n=1 Tax=Phyllotreta striolata TaxID=444603 RepID=A0A9N9XN37_PHYSR|nr:unnamed protein product [Phyllotreta striolata]